MHADHPLPRKPEAERAILGAALVDEKALLLAERHLSAYDFFIPAHKRIFSEMQQLARSCQAVELVALCDALQSDSEVAALGGAAFIASLGDGVHKNAPVESWAKSVREASWLRQVAYNAESLIEASIKPGAMIDEVVAQIESLGRFGTSGVQPTDNRLVTVAVDELLAREIKQREMLLDPILPEQGLAMLYAYRGIGKTFLALGIAAAIASGGRFLRWNALRARPVLYVDGELPAKTLQERVAMVLAGSEGSEPRANALKFITPDLQNRPIPDLATTTGQRMLEPFLEGVSLVVLDNLSALCRAGNENEGESWLPVQEWALRLRKSGISVLFVHHAGKNKSQRAPLGAKTCSIRSSHLSIPRTTIQVRGCDAKSILRRLERCSASRQSRSRFDFKAVRTDRLSGLCASWKMQSFSRRARCMLQDRPCAMLPKNWGSADRTRVGYGKGGRPSGVCPSVPPHRDGTRGQARFDDNDTGEHKR